MSDSPIVLTSLSAYLFCAISFFFNEIQTPQWVNSGNIISICNFPTYIFLTVLPIGEETLHWAQLSTGWTEGQWHQADKCSTNPHGLSLRDSVQWAQFSSGCSENRVRPQFSSVTEHTNTNCAWICHTGIKGHRLDSTIF